MIKKLEKNSLYTNKVSIKKDWLFSTTSSHAKPDDIKVLDGENISGVFYPSQSKYYNVNSEPVNYDGSYKRVIFNQDKINFYTNDLYKIIHPDINLYIEDKIKSIRFSKKIVDDGIIPKTLEIEDFSNGDLRLNFVDDGNGNLVNSDSSKLVGFHNNVPVNNVNYKLNKSVKYFDLSGNEISKESAIELYKNGGEVKEEIINEEVVGEMPTYDPINERYGFSIDTSEEYLLVSSISDENSFSLSKNGKVILNKNLSGSNYKAIKIFKSPFQSSLALESSYENFLSNEYGDFILSEASDLICLSESYYRDNFGFSVAINGNFCAITSPFVRNCMSPCETGSGLVYCYEKNKGGDDNWGIINVLQGESAEDHFGYSVSIKNDLLVVGAPKYSGSLGAVYIFRKKIYESENKRFYTPTSSVGYDFLLTDVTSSLLSASVDSEYKNLKTQTFYRNFWTPISKNCFVSITSNVYEPIKSDLDFLDVPEILTEDGQLKKIFSPLDPVPNYVKNDFSWILETKLTGDDVGDEFGGCVSVDNNIIVIGNSNPSGSQLAWVYTCSSSFDENGYPNYNWSKKSTLQITDGDLVSDIPNNFNFPSDNSGFGHSVSIDGEYIYVGAPFDRILNNKFVGSSVIYRRRIERDFCGNLSLVTKPIKKISSFDTTEKNSFFGYSGKIKNDKLLISAPNNFYSNFNIISYENNKFNIEELSLSDSNDNNFFVYDLIDDEIKKVSQIDLYKKTGEPKKFYGKSVSIEKNNFFIGSPVLSKTNDLDISPYMSQSVITNISNWNDNQSSKLSGSVLVYQISNEIEHIGNVFYQAGQIVVTNNKPIYQKIMSMTGSFGYNLKYCTEEKSFISDISIPIKVGEFNVSTNPTSIYGRTLLLDVNSDKLFDINDLNLILKYINGETPKNSTSDNFIEIQSNENSWWKNDLILTESEDAIIIEGLLSSKNLDAYTQDIVDKIQTQYVDTLLIDINGDGVVDEKDGNLLLNYWLGNIDVDIVEKNTNLLSTRNTLESIINYINILLGKYSPYSTNTNPSIPQIYNSGNGGLINKNSLGFLSSSLSDPTGSYLSTYITSVGLYSDGDLVMVGKFGTPIKNIIEYPINLSIKFELF